MCVCVFVHPLLWLKLLKQCHSHKIYADGGETEARARVTEGKISYSTMAIMCVCSVQFVCVFAHLLVCLCVFVCECMGLNICL